MWSRGLTQCDIELYRGNLTQAWEALAADGLRIQLTGALFVPQIRGEYLLRRAGVALACHAIRPRIARREVHKAARALRGLAWRHGRAAALLLEAGLAHQQGRAAMAREHLALAADATEGLLRWYAHASLARLDGGPWPPSLDAEIDPAMLARHVLPLDFQPGAT